MTFFLLNQYNSLKNFFLQLNKSKETILYIRLLFIKSSQIVEHIIILT